MSINNVTHDQTQTRRDRQTAVVAMIDIRQEASSIRNRDNKISFYENKIEELRRNPTSVNIAIQSEIQSAINRLRNPPERTSVNNVISPNAGGKSYKKHKGKSHKKRRGKSHKKRKGKSSRKK
jgi:hypothetical protein